MRREHNALFYGWWIVGACFLTALYVRGVVTFGFTAVFESLANEFGWSYLQISIAASLRGVETGLLAPLLGYLVDRWGPRRLMFTGAIINGLGLMLLSRVNSLIMFYGAFVLLAIGTSTCSSTVLTTAVVNWFRRRVAMAVGIASSGVALGGLLVPLVAVLIDRLDWRTAMFVLGLGMWGIALPVSLLVRHRPEQYGYEPDGEVKTGATIGKDLALEQNAEVSISAKTAIRSRAFWHVALAYTCGRLVISAVVTHIMPYLGSIQIARSVSSLVAGLVPVMSMGGRLGFGWLGGKLHKKQATAVTFAFVSLGLLSLSYVAGEKTWLLICFLIFFSLGWGGNVIMGSVLLREYCGRHNFGTIYGIFIGMTMVGNITGAPVAGWAFDTWHHYQGIWLIFAGLAMMAVLVVLSTPPPSNRIREADK